MVEPGASTDPVLPEAKMNLLTPREPGVAKVVSTELCMNGKSNSFVRHIAFDVSGTPLAGNFLAGQSFGVIPPGVDENGKPHHVRLFSIACPSWGEDGEGNIISTTPKRVIDEYKPQDGDDDPDDHSLFLGICSNYLCDRRVGDEVKITGPSGKRFLLPVDPNAHDYFFVATGTGMAPFRGMVSELLENPAGTCTSRIHLLMGSPYTTDLLYHGYFEEMAAKHDNFHYHTAVSREAHPQVGRGIYVDRLLDLHGDVFGELLSNPRSLMYMCGLKGMEVGVYKNMARMGVADAYLAHKDDPEIMARPDDWTAEVMKKIRPTGRAMVEVY